MVQDKQEEDKVVDQFLNRHYFATYICQDCQNEFSAPGTSRRRFCDTCAARRQRESWKSRKPKGEE